MSTWSDLKNNPRLKNIYQQRIEIIKLIREFFWAGGFLETETPVAVKLPGQEPYLNPVEVKFHDPRGAEHQFYLQTSPEFAMKKLLAAGFGKIFQICKCFRDYENFGGRHNTEFTMLEWYRAPGTLAEIMDDTEKLFKSVYLSLRGGARATTKQSPGFQQSDIIGQWDRVSMKEIWQKYIGVNLDDYLEIEKIKKLAGQRGYSVDEKDTYEDLFFKIFLNGIESKLGLERPIFVYDYPARMCSLSKLCADPRYAERFELYIGGLELANAFGELTDAKIQKQQLEKDRKHRLALGKPVWPVDPDFISALESGIPSAGGIALGVDRMVLLFTGAKDINEVIFQSINDQINI